MRISTLAILFPLVAPLSLHAAIFERDFLEPGDGLLTYDDVNRREWLDLTYTSGVSLKGIQSLMTTNGIFEQFEFATLEDIEPFASSAGVVWQSQGVAAHSEQTYKNAIDLHDLLGNVYSFRVDFDNIVAGTSGFLARYSSHGQVAKSTTNGELSFDGTNVYVTYIEFPASATVLVNGGPYGVITSESPIGDIAATGNTGPFWLYREAVPEPATLGMFILSVILAAAFRLRSHTEIGCSTP